MSETVDSTKPCMYDVPSYKNIHCTSLCSIVMTSITSFVLPGHYQVFNKTRGTGAQALGYHIGGPDDRGGRQGTAGRAAMHSGKSWTKGWFFLGGMGWHRAGNRDFIRRLRTVHNFTLINDLFLELSTYFQPRLTTSNWDRMQNWIRGIIAFISMPPLLI